MAYASISINVSPATVSVGGLYTVSGYLVDATSSVGLTSRTVNVFCDAVQTASDVTDASGFYTSAINAYVATGTHIIKSVFNGD